MTRAEYLALAERAERAEGADRELDAAIEAALTGRVTHPRAPGWTMLKQDADWKLAKLAESPFISVSKRPAPAFTASLDAALSLVPDGWHLALEPIFLDDGERVAYDAICVKPPWAAWRPHDPQSRHDKVQIAAVAAALRARAEEASDD